MRTRRRRRRHGWALVAAGVLLGSGPAAAERELVDRVVAQVEGEAILLSDVLREMNLARMQQGLGEMNQAQQDALFRQILDGMIDDQLLVVAAKEKGFEPGDTEVRKEVDGRIASIKQQLGGEEAYRAELERQGMTEAEILDMHREQAIKQILAARIVQSELRSKVKITDDRVEEFYTTQRDSLPEQLLRSPERLKLAHILTVPRVEENKRQTARDKIDAARQRIVDGEDFAQVAREISEWPNAARGGDLGQFRYGDFDLDQFDEVVSKLQPSDLSDVFETQLGLMLVQLESRKGDVMRARLIVVKAGPDEGAFVEALERAQEIRRRLLQGESFEELAAKYSDDPATRDNGGELENEWVPDELLPSFRQAIEDLGVGDVSGVVRSANGFHLIKILRRIASQENSYEDIQEALRRYLEQVELEKLFRDYVAGLRNRYFVDVKA